MLIYNEVLLKSEEEFEVTETSDSCLFLFPPKICIATGSQLSKYAISDISSE